jgi:hypothetical protein
MSEWKVVPIHQPPGFQIQRVSKSGSMRIALTIEFKDGKTAKECAGFMNQIIAKSAMITAPIILMGNLADAS